jgi:hypothetical protein
MEKFKLHDSVIVDKENYGIYFAADALYEVVQDGHEGVIVEIDKVNMLYGAYFKHLEDDVVYYFSEDELLQFKDENRNLKAAMFIAQNSIYGAFGDTYLSCQETDPEKIKNLINDFMEGNGLEDNVVHVRHKLDGDIEQRLSEILEDFHHYLECHK